MVFNRKLDLAKHRVDMHLHRLTKYRCKYCTRRKQFSSQAMLFFHLKLVHGVRRWTAEARVQRGEFNVVQRKQEGKLEQEVEVCFQEEDTADDSDDGCYTLDQMNNQQVAGIKNREVDDGSKAELDENCNKW